MNGYNFTDRVRKVLQMAREEAARLHHEYVGTEHILLGLIREGEGVAAAVLTNLNVDLEDIQQKIEETVKKGKAGRGRRPRPAVHLARQEGARAGHDRGARAQSLLRRHRAPAARPAARGEGHRGPGAHRRRREPRAEPRGDAAPARERHAADVGRRQPSGSQPALGAQVREEVQDARARPLLPRPHPARRRGPARSDDRPGQGDRARHGDPGAPEEEQSGAHRRARRRQDGHRRGAGAAHRQRALPRRAARPPRALARHGGGHRRHQVPRPVRGAAQGGDERDRAEQADHPVHRRAAHAGRRRRGRRRDRRLQHAQARARARRAAVRRRVHAQRVPQVHREGRRARAPLPDRRRRAAHGRRDGRDPQGPPEEVRGPPPDQHSRRDARRGGGAVGALHHRPVPAGQGDRRDRRGRRPRPAGVAGPAGRGGGAQGRAGEGQPAEGRRGPRPELRARRVAPRPGARAPEPDPAQAGGVGEGAPDPPAGDRRGGHRVHRVALDRHSGHPAAGGRDRPADADGRRDPRVGGRPGRGHQGRVPRHPPLARRPQGPQPADRLVHLLRPHGRRQDRAGPGAGASSCSPTRRPSSGSTCRSTWRSSRSRA